MLNNAKSYTDRQVSKVGAASAALAGLHYLDYNPNDKWSFATSLGHYKHSTAGAIGASYQPNENSMVHAGVTVGGERMFNIVLLSKWANKIRHSKQAALKWQNKSKTYKLIMHHCAQTTKNYELKLTKLKQR